jgi:N6-L-threonylcarbamoyladenine synthase
MKVLAIETSCDDTGISILEVKKSGKNDVFKILANNINSQVKIHAEFGGVFPMMAKREHQKNLPIVLEETLRQAKIKMEKIDVITVTYGPGLEPALWTGIVFAKELSLKYKIPIIKVNHMEGHMFSIFPKKGKTFTINSGEKIFPMLSLLVSGGHTELILVKDWHKYKKIGQTRDDAAGEAFDKVARMLGLQYPGGPEISRLAGIERSNILSEILALDITLPRPMIYSKDYDFSFSGLKTAVLYMIRDLKEKNPNILEDENIKQKIAKEFEDAVVETLVYKTIKAIKQYKIKTLIVGGGVSANVYLQKQMEEKVKELKQSKVLPYSVKVHFPIKSLTGDNALMIGIAGYYGSRNKKFVKNLKFLKAQGNLSL